MDYFNERFTRTSVAELQEYCAKNKMTRPIYEFSVNDEGFQCRVVTDFCRGIGNAPKKRDAKHLAAANVLMKIERSKFVDYSGVFEKPNEDTPGDMILLLRNYCVRQKQQLPKCEVIKQETNNTKTFPLYTATFKMGDIEKSAESRDDMHAKQLAALDMLRHFNVGELNEYCFEKSNMLQTGATFIVSEEECNKKYSAYLKFIGGDDTPRKQSVPLSDRHNYFARYPAEMKKAAFDAIEGSFESDRDQAMAVLDALALIPKQSPVPSTQEPLIAIEMNCDFEMIFIATEEEIYREIIDYFAVMLL